MISFVFLLVVVIIVVYVLCLVIDWLCGQVSLPAPIPMILKLLVVLMALYVLFSNGMPLLGSGGLRLR